MDRHEHQFVDYNAFWSSTTTSTLTSSTPLANVNANVNDNVNDNDNDSPPVVQVTSTNNPIENSIEIPIDIDIDIDIESTMKQRLTFTSDKVLRILDANTIKLEHNGLVTFASISTPSGYSSNPKDQFPSCITTSPSYKVRQLLPIQSKVQIYILNTGMDASISTTRPRAALILNDKNIFVNGELVKDGYAKPILSYKAKSSSSALVVLEDVLPGMQHYLISLQNQAMNSNVGLYMSCELDATGTCTGSGIDSIPVDATTSGATGTASMIIDLDHQFEPMEYTVETKWGEDGGAPILKQRITPKSYNALNPPPNPGDVRKCSDFDTYEQALRYFEILYPYYGDVAQLDRDGDGIPCSGLVHTSIPERYRVKKSILR